MIRSTYWIVNDYGCSLARWNAHENGRQLTKYFGSAQLLKLGSLFTLTNYFGYTASGSENNIYGRLIYNPKIIGFMRGSMVRHRHVYDNGGVTLGFPTMWYVRPAKPHISLPIRAV